MTSAIFLQTKTVAKCTQDVAVSADPADETQTRVRFERFEKDSKSFMKRLTTKVLEPRLFISLVKESHFIETNPGETV
ncbi:hypothetical protein SBDP1_220030 [Syntrophobacter sp. SbD1]|nr:hypothetical protein SBDP1_220030 [Syntrophobacter sp. SbD1]